MELIVLLVVVAVTVWQVSKWAHKPKAKREAHLQQKYSADPAKAKDIVSGSIRVGMSEEEVIDAWGRPTSSSKKMLKHKWKSTLYYGSVQYGRKVYLENDRVVGWKV